MAETSYAEMAQANALLKQALLRQMPEPGKYPTAAKGFFLARHNEAQQAESCFYKPSAGLIVQGFKRSVVGSEVLCYGEMQCLVAGVDMPSTFYIAEASPQRPFLAVSLELDPCLISRLAAVSPPASAPAAGMGGKSIYVHEVEPEILSAFLRLAELLEKPEQLPVLAPLIVREIHYRLLLGPCGAMLRQVNTLGTQSHQVARAVAWLRQNFSAPLRVEELASQVHMAPSTFYRRFKEVTTLSPLQYHKHLRLYEAQRLMLAESRDATEAALAVGYESPAQFNREYKRLFGAPPLRDIKRMSMGMTRAPEAAAGAQTIEPAVSRLM